MAKKTTKKTAKKVAKKAAKKTTKKVANKAPAKRTKKESVDLLKLTERQEKDSLTISKEEAIKKYKETLAKSEPVVEEEIVDDEMEPETVESEFGDENEVLAGDAPAENYSSFDNNNVEEYNPDDEEDELESGEYNYGWGYNNSFDDPEEASQESNIEDEDEAYARGTGIKDE